MVGINLIIFVSFFISIGALESPDSTLSVAALVPLSARLYAGAVLKTGSRVKLRDAWRSAGLTDGATGGP